MSLSRALVCQRQVSEYVLQVKCGLKSYGFTVAQMMYVRENSFVPSNEWPRWMSLHFTTIPYGSASGRSFPEFFCVKHPNCILWWGIGAVFENKDVFMVVYFNAKMDCIVHECYLIQLDVATYLTPSLYVKDRNAYKSFTRLRLENNDFYDQKIKADRFEYVSKINNLEMVVRLSNDNGKTWTRYKLTFSPETMTPALTLIPSDQKP